MEHDPAANASIGRRKPVLTFPDHASALHQIDVLNRDRTAVAEIHNKNSKAMPGQTLEYPYTIRLQHLVFGTWYDCGPWDPSLFNQG